MDESNKDKVLSVESIRDELRGAIFNTAFMSGFGKYDGSAEGLKQSTDYKNLACNFIAFGVNAGLISITEANAWKDAVFEKQVLGEVLLKYKDGKAVDD